ncbi:MAG: photosystem II stability/assembly factor-like uncharacterized protein [Bacteroidia bacterium]|jgi:photosystem II stability/assembly factor-like uncharacterized protein
MVQPLGYLFRFLTVWFVFTSSWSIAQVETKKVKWKALGPIELPSTPADTGTWSANGLGWVELVYNASSKEKWLYAGSNTGGLYRSKNFGKKWKFVADFDRMTGVLDLVVDDRNHKEIWAATGMNSFETDWGWGILYSKNGGKKWQKTGLCFEPIDKKVVWCVERSKSNPDVFYACTDSEIYVSTDRCSSFTKTFESEKKQNVFFKHLIVNESDENQALASGFLFLRTQNGGKTWQDVSAALSFTAERNRSDALPDRYATSANPQDPNKVLCAYKYGSYNYVELSLDFGRTWTLVSKNRSFSRLDRHHAELAWHPTDSNIIFVGSVRMYRSLDGGKQFHQMSFPAFGLPNFMHDDVRDLKVLPDGRLLVGSDGGVYVSSDTGKTWQDISGKGLNIMQFYDIAVDSGRIVGGCQDLSSMIYVNGNWSNTSQIYGDGGSCYVDGKDVYVLQHGDVVRKGSFENKEWKTIPLPIRSGRFYYPFMMSPYDTSKFWFTDHHLWQYDGSGDFTVLSKTIMPGITKIVALEVNESNPRIVYMAKDQPTWDPSPNGLKDRLYKGIWMEDSFGWVDITGNLGILAWRGITSIETNPNNENEVYVSLQLLENEHRHKVYKSMDGGGTWENISAGLPNLNAHKILWNPINESLFLGTDEGVFCREKDGSSWAALVGKMPPYFVTDLEIDLATNRLYVATYGGGVWYCGLKGL